MLNLLNVTIAVIFVGILVCLSCLACGLYNAKLSFAISNQRSLPDVALGNALSDYFGIYLEQSLDKNPFDIVIPTSDDETQPILQRLPLRLKPLSTRELEKIATDGG